MCFRNSWFDEKIQDMPYALFEKITQSLPSAPTTIMFGGMGEPMSHPRIFDMITACKELGHHVEMITNGSLLTDTTIQQLLAGKVDRLWISLDKLSAEEEADLAGHPKTASILANIARLNTLRSAGIYAKTYPLELGIAFVVCAENIAQLKELPYFIKKYHIDHVTISHMKMEASQKAQDTLYDKTLNMKLGSTKVKRPTVHLPYMDFSRPDVADVFSSLFSTINFLPHIGNAPIARKTQYCKFVEEGMVFIRSDGNISPCMELLHNGTTALGETHRTIHHHSFGNITEQSLEDIWNSTEYANFRKKVKEFSFSPCTHCGHCSDTESNLHDCLGNTKPCCGACLWAEGLLSCP